MAANYADQYNNGEIEEVFPRIWRVPVPLPDNPLNYLNSYFILSDDKTTIVDVGFDHPDCEKALDDALRKLGRTWESVEIVLTHSHPDHTSNLDRISATLDAHIRQHALYSRSAKPHEHASNGIQPAHRLSYAPQHVR